jgi:A/G-specific adenine glycosylase
LPGVGRSTAGAILALSRGERFPILDGNVRRVLSRYFGVQAGTSNRVMSERLWRLAEHCTPHEHVEVYTQAIMDLGATVCTRHKPLCAYCPLSEGCVARRTGRQQEFPAPKPGRPVRRAREVFMLVAMRDDGSVLLERRPESGVWGGLWCLPEFATATAASAFARNFLQTAQSEPQPLGVVEHGFTHFDLVITPLLTRCAGSAGVMDAPRSLWYNIRNPTPVGLPAPVKTLLEHLASGSLFDERIAG